MSALSNFLINDSKIEPVLSLRSSAFTLPSLRLIYLMVEPFEY